MRRLCLLVLCGWATGTTISCGGGGDGGNGPPTITSVVVSGDSTVVLNGTRQLTATAMDGSTPVSTGVTFEWSSSNNTFVTVSQTGLATGVVIPGSANVTARAVLNGTPTNVVSAPHLIRVRIGSIVLTPADTLRFSSLGDTIVLRGQARDALNQPIPNGTRPIVFNTSDPQIVALTSATGGSPVDSIRVIAMGNGLAQVIASAQGESITDSAPALVRQVAVTFAADPDTARFNRIGATVIPVLTLADARGNFVGATAVSWTSQDPGVAIMDVNGLVSVNEGQTRVIGTAGALKDTIVAVVGLVYKTVEITSSGALAAPIDTARLNRLNGTLQLGLVVRDSGNTVVPNPQGVTWSLHTGTIASIGTGTGLVTGNTSTGQDTVVLVARTARDSVPLVVKQVLASIVVTPATPDPLNFVSDTQRFAAEPRDSGGAAIAGKTVTWATNNIKLRINSAGLATADSATSATGIVVKIKATVDALTDSSRSIVVKQIPVTADLNPNSFTPLTAFGRQATASCVVLDSAADTIPNHPCNWSAVTSGIVTFNPAAGKTTTITAVGNGNTTIQAQASTPLFAFNSITVDQIPKTVTITPANFGTPDVTMRTGQSAPFFATVLDSLNQPALQDSVDWSTNSSGVANVAATSSLDSTVVTTGSAGTATITATAGPASASRVVNVSATPISFATQVVSVFTGAAGCDGCHPPNQNLNLSTVALAYSNLVGASGQGVASTEVPALRRVRPFRPDSSYLVHKIQGTQATVGGSGARMPLGCAGASCLSNTIINTIRNWVLQGALNN